MRSGSGKTGHRFSWGDFSSAAPEDQCVLRGSRGERLDLLMDLERHYFVHFLEYR